MVEASHLADLAETKQWVISIIKQWVISIIRSARAVVTVITFSLLNLVSEGRAMASSPDILGKVMFVTGQIGLPGYFWFNLG